MAATQTSYDEIPYHSNPFRESRPERLAAIARLFGLTAPPVENCRVLEIGCSMGGNLLSMAQDYPQSQFLGIDASSRQIAEGWKTVELLGLKNIRLKHLDLLDFGPEHGEFDYIVSHGVFSWVPPRVQGKMLEICQRHLAPNGVAYISYNTYPGWHIRGIVRDIMLYRGMQFAEPAVRLQQAKLLVEFVAQATRGADTPYQKLLQSELGHMAQMEDYYLHHDHLEENNHPLYFHEFARRLAVNGLQYLGEADFSMMVSTNFSSEVAKTLNDLGANDILQMEQYMDFVRCRYFRKTLICRSGVKLNRVLAPTIVKGFLLASNASSEAGEVALDPSRPVAFQTLAGHKLTCRAALTKAALQFLRAQWPGHLSFADLLLQAKNVAAEAGFPADENAEDFLAAEVLTAMAAGVMEWRVSPTPYTTVVGATPASTPLARLQADRGYRATNLRGENVSLDEIHRQTLRLLDGVRTNEKIIDALIETLKRGDMVLHRDDDNKTPLTNEAEMRRLLVPALENVLLNLSKKALLVRADIDLESARRSFKSGSGT